MNQDPQETDPKYKEIFESVDAELQKHYENVERYMGFCHKYWGLKKAVLRQKYGIDWKTPSEMNPDTLFD